MADPEVSLDAALRSLGDSVSRGQDVHPSHEQLTAYCRGELTPEESEAVAAHIAWCREDADFVLAFREVTGLDPGEEESEEELDAAWRDFQKRRAATVAGPAAPVSAPTPRPQGGGRRWRMPLTWAATVLVAVVSTWLVATLVRPDRPAPQANTVIVDLGATDEERTAGAEVTEIVLQADETAVTVILHPTRELTAKRFAAALLGRDGKEIWQADVRPTELETFHLTFPREYLSAGDYVFELRSQDDGGVEVLDRFPVRIVLEDVAGASSIPQG